MKEGFYFYRKKVYYGRYDETQMCGYASFSIIKPELIQSEHPICEDDRAVRLWDNHRLLEPEYADLRTMLLKMSLFMNLNTEETVDFSAVEEKLGRPFPEELKLIYTAIHHQEEFLWIKVTAKPISQWITVYLSPTLTFPLVPLAGLQTI